MSASRAAFLALLPVSLLLSACAASGPPPRVVRAADLPTLGALATDQAVIVEFKEGDVIPLRFTLDGPFVASPKDAPPIPLRARQRFFLRIDKGGVTASADGKTFDASPDKPGLFKYGVGASRDGVTASLTIRTPTPAGATEAR